MKELIHRQAVLDLLKNETTEIHITSNKREECTIAEINVNELKSLPIVRLEEDKNE